MTLTFDQGKQPHNKNRVQIDASVRLEFCSQAGPDIQTDTQTDRQTHIHTQTHTQTNCNKNVSPPRFRGGVMNAHSFVEVVEVKSD